MARLAGSPQAAGGRAQRKVRGGHGCGCSAFRGRAVRFEADANRWAAAEEEALLPSLLPAEPRLPGSGQ